MKQIFLITMGSFLLWSCNNTTEQSSAPKQESVVAESLEHEKISEAVQLDNGERWSVNEEMKPFLEKGESLVNAFIQEGKSDYNALAKSVKEQNDLLIKSCTMDGKSHEELHKWLHPHLDLVKKLENEADNARAAEEVLDLQKSYQQYHQYFK